MFSIAKHLVQNTPTFKGRFFNRYFGKDLTNHYQGCVAVVFKDYRQERGKKNPTQKNPNRS